MKPVNQTIVDKWKGTCVQAVLASLFETKLEETVNIMDFLDTGWQIPFMDWVEDNTPYEYAGVINAHDEKELTYEALQSVFAVKGYFYGVVPSKNFSDVTHAVIIDRGGVIVHDPDPKKKWLGLNPVESGELQYWYLFEPQNGFIYPK